MHGRLLAGLAAWAIDRDHGDPAFVPARLTVDMFKSPAMKETRVSTILVRAGGRVRVADALIQVGGVDVARASALYLRKGDAPVDDAPVTPAWDSIVPGAGEPEFEAPFEVRPIDGMGFGAPGPRPAPSARGLRPLVTGEALTPFIRAAVVSDIASPLANSASEGLEYINADAALYLAGRRRASGLASSTPIGWRPTAYRPRAAGCTTRRADRLERGLRGADPCGHLPRWEEPEA